MLLIDCPYCGMARPEIEFTTAAKRISRGPPIPPQSR
jgi:sarcosine oxidase delta subunit